jgi:thioredoxin reductase (NADPH)
VTKITPDEVLISTPGGTKTIPNDFVLALTGYKPNFNLMKRFGIKLSDDKKRMPLFDDETLETNRDGMYVAGVVCGGMDTSSLFIENTRIHAKHIAEDISADVAD